jgi:outer membrane protein assembly factor BamB
MTAAPLLLAALLGAAAGAPAAVDEGAPWPQWGGPGRDGSSPVTGVFGGGPIRLREVWRWPSDGGFSALAVAGGRLFSLLSAADGNDYAFALDARTGKELWRVALGPSFPAMEYGIASTPATDGRLVFVLNAGCKLLALAAESGAAVWQHDLPSEYGARQPPGAGCWTSPLLAGNLLVVLVNGDPDRRVMAFDRNSGAAVWSSPGIERSSRGSPLLAEIGGVRQVVVHDYKSAGEGGLYGLGLQDGALLWSVRFSDAQSFSYDMPIPLGKDRLGVVTWSGLRAVAVRREGGRFNATVLWSSPDIRAETQPVKLHAVFHAGHVYGFGSDFLYCLDAATGRTVWREKIYPGSLILADGHLIAISQAAGFVRLIEATPAGYREKGRLEVFARGAPTDTPPSFAGRRIYLRNSEQVVAIEVAAAAH